MRDAVARGTHRGYRDYPMKVGWMRLPENDREEINDLILAALVAAAVIVSLVYLSWYF
ncbi:hypothetical protein AB7813_08850 [Tardiphaga sp. 20_F10_N6_6]|uniref:hypothetical protein n=1 Tax=Tardiphaga sp. 20_F10_N6_6 TaxID=3240788 RepID=UPI003F89B27F